MGEDLIKSVFTVATAIIGLAIIAVLVSRNANTAGVISSAGGALATDIGAAVSPVSGGSSWGNNFGSFSGGASYPSMGF